MNTLTAHWSRPVATPSAGRLKAFGRRVWRALEATGQARAQRALLDFAYQCDATQPSLAQELRAAALRGPSA